MEGEKRCATCRWDTFKFNKPWCDLKSEPYPKVCGKWTPKEQTMSDLIKRSDAIQQMALMLEDISEDLSEQIIQRFGYESAEELATEAMSIIPSADRPQEWIPCSERLPSKGVAVLVNGIMYDAPPITISTDAPYYYEQGWINAWMPLPEPWKGADDDSKRD